MKRVKKGFRMELRDGNGLVVAVECGGKLRMKESTPTTFDAVDLTAAQCEAAGITAALEDVPTPGQRLHEECKALRGGQPCEGRYCERHAKAAAVREADAALRAAREAVAKARDEVVAAAKRYAEGEPRGLHVLDAVELLWDAESVEAEARARLEALR